MSDAERALEKAISEGCILELDGAAKAFDAIAGRRPEMAAGLRFAAKTLRERAEAIRRETDGGHNER